MSDTQTWARQRKFALCSIAFCLVQVGIFVISAMLIHFSLVNVEPSPSPGVQGATIYRLLAGVWLFGAPITFIAVLLAMRLDSKRSFAMIALFVSILTFFFCTLQMLV